jgi:hypothetical protein
MENTYTWNDDAPIDAIHNWQKWYRENHSVLSMTEPMTIGNSVDKLVGDAEKMSFTKATEYFADTIAEFSNELSSEQMYKALLKAATDNYNYTKGEYDKAKNFLELINGTKEKA